MQDLDKRRKLEREVDVLLEIRDPEIEVLAKQAQAALKRGAYGEAAEHVTEAQALYRPPVKVAKLLADKGVTKSVAASRRLIQTGKVLVDGVPLRKADASVKPDQVVTFMGQVLQGD
jgi:ribosome-associated protein YbcJ (S4-like RNA binding protein)